MLKGAVWMGDNYLLSTGILYLSTGQKLLIYVLITKWREKRPGGRGLNISGNFMVGYKRRERPGTEVRTCNPSPPEAQGRGSPQIFGNSYLQSDFPARQGHAAKAHFKAKKETTEDSTQTQSITLPV